jgi:hypothetical protein
VFAGAERVGGEIGARAEIIAQVRPANGDPVAILILRIGDFKFGKDGMLAEVLESKALIPAELPAQLNLPVLEGHSRGFVQPGQLRGFSLLFGALFPWFLLIPLSRFRASRHRCHGGASMIL